MINKPLDIEKILITEDGIRDFYWPINADKMYQDYFCLLSSIIPLIRKAKKDGVNGVDAVMILYHYFIIEVMSLYEASSLLFFSKQDEVSWLYVDRNPWVRIIQENKSADTSFIIRRLRQAPMKPRKHRVPLRFIRDLLVSKKEGMVRRSIKPCDYSKDVVSLTLNPLAIRHAKEISGKVYYQRDEFWFQKIDIIPQISDYSELIENLLVSVTTTLDNISEKLQRYFREWLEIAIPLTDAYLRQLEEKSEIPQRLWVGTTGHLWGRILSRYVRNHGGHVTRFDHGSGAAYFYSLHAQGKYDVEDCDKFITFSKNQSESIYKVFKGNEIIDEKCPEITGLNSNRYENASTNFIGISKPIKKVMYVASIYPNGYFYPAAKRFMRNHVLLDWEVRLMAKLQDWGYKILFKPHPTDDICLAPPKSIEDLFGSIRIDRLFEEVCHQADLILLDDPSTTLLSTLVKSDKPVVYMDFGVTEFSPEALALIKKRFAVVKGSYNEKNRAVIDWDELKRGIKMAPKLMDKSFYYHYF